MTGSRVAIGGVLVAALSFWLGRRSAAPEPPPPVDPLPISASWDGGVLLKSDVDSYFASAGRADPSARKELVASLARQALLASAARARGIDRTPFVRRQCDEAMVEALRSGQLDSAAPIAESEFRAVYDADLSRYSHEGGVRLAHILIRAAGDGTRQASALLKELTASTQKDFYAFADAAHLHSIDGASKVAGGELPLMSDAQLKETFGVDFAAQLEPLAPGALLPRVVSSPRGLHLVRFIERVPSSTTPFERVRENIATRLRAERSAKAWTEFVQHLETDTGFTLTEP